MRIFLDTNILLDIVEKRQPFLTSSQEILDRCDALKFETFIASHGLATIFYLAARKSGRDSAWSTIRRILGFAQVAPLGDADARKALILGIPDFEDALQAAAASACMADFLVTRDASGFPGSPVPKLSPDEFLQRFPTSRSPSG